MEIAMKKVLTLASALSLCVLNVPAANANGIGSVLGQVMRLIPHGNQQQRRPATIIQAQYPDTAHNSNCAGSWGEGCWSAQDREALYRRQGLLRGGSAYRGGQPGVTNQRSGGTVTVYTTVHHHEEHREVNVTPRAEARHVQVSVGVSAPDGWEITGR